jgi:hypothetical protein
MLVLLAVKEFKSLILILVISNIFNSKIFSLEILYYRTVNRLYP